MVLPASPIYSNPTDRRFGLRFTTPVFKAAQIAVWQRAVVMETKCQLRLCRRPARQNSRSLKILINSFEHSTLARATATRLDRESDAKIAKWRTGLHQKDHTIPFVPLLRLRVSAISLTVLAGAVF